MGPNTLPNKLNQLSVELALKHWAFLKVKCLGLASTSNAHLRLMYSIIN